MLETIDDVATVIAGVETLISLILAFVFTFVYALLFRWWKRPEGRAILYLFLALLSVSLIAVLAVWVSPDYWLRGIWRAVGWGFVVFALGNLLRLLWKNFRHGSNITVERKPTGETPIIRKHEG